MKLLASAVNGDTSFSEWEFDATYKGGARIKLNEVAVRRWKNGQSRRKSASITTRANLSLFIAQRLFGIDRAGTQGRDESATPRITAMIEDGGAKDAGASGRVLQSCEFIRRVSRKPPADQPALPRPLAA